MQPEQGSPVGRQNINIDRNIEEKTLKIFVKIEKNTRERMKNRKEYTLSPVHIPFKILRKQEFINDIFKIINIKFDSLFQAG